MNNNNWFVDNIDTNSFIAEVERRPELWDNKAPDNSFKKRLSSWDSICEIFNKDYSSKSDIERHDMRRQLQRRWKSLRDSFTREISKIKSSNSQGEGCTERKPYMYFKELVFLLDVVDCGNDGVLSQQYSKISDDNRTTKENFPYNDRLEDFQNGSDNISLDSCSESQSKSHQKAANSLTNSRTGDDGDELFLLSLSKELNKVPDEFKMDVKLEILQAIMKGQKRALQHEETYVSFGSVGTNVAIECANSLNASSSISQSSVMTKKKTGLNRVNSIIFIQ